MPRVIIGFILIFFLLLPGTSPAETIELKNGKKIVGDIIEETDDAVTVSRHDGGFVYSISRDRVSAIRESTPDELKRLEQEQDLYKTDRNEDKERLDRLTSFRKERYEEQVLSAKKSRGRIKIKFSGNRFGVVDATINGKVKASLLVDTGASLVVISGNVARQLGIENTGGMDRMSVVLADGSVTTAIPITLDSLEVGSQKVKNVSAAISEETAGDGIDGLLGMSFLKYFHVKMDAENNSLILEKY